MNEGYVCTNHYHIESCCHTLIALASREPLCFSSDLLVVVVVVVAEDRAASSAASTFTTLDAETTALRFYKTEKEEVQLWKVLETIPTILIVYDINSTYRFRVSFCAGGTPHSVRPCFRRSQK